MPDADAFRLTTMLTSGNNAAGGAAMSNPDGPQESARGRRFWSEPWSRGFSRQVYAQA